MFIKYLFFGLFLLIISGSYQITSASLTENQIRDEIKFLSQTIDGIKPSRLRAYLLADLKRALSKQSTAAAASSSSSSSSTSVESSEINCSSDADLKVIPNCTCIDYACRTQSTSLRRRSSIQRSCEDFCCRRTNEFVRKSLSINGGNDHNRPNVHRTKLNDCQISPDTLFNNNNNNNSSSSTNTESFNTFVYGLAQIYQSKSTATSKRPICLGSLIHSRIILTTVGCVASAKQMKRVQIKIGEKIDQYQYQYQIRNVTKRIWIDNNNNNNNNNVMAGDLVTDKFGPDMALLILNKDIKLTNHIRTMCLSPSPPSSLSPSSSNQLPTTTTTTRISNSNSLVQGKCYIFSLEYKNGRILEQKQEVILRTPEYCHLKSKLLARRQMMIMNGQNLICATPIQEDSIKITSNGAPLMCSYRQNGQNEEYLLETGLLMHRINGDTELTSSSSPPPPLTFYLFTNLTNSINWIDKNIQSFEL